MCNIKSYNIYIFVYNKTLTHYIHRSVKGKYGVTKVNKTN